MFETTRTLLGDIKFATELADGMAVSNKILLAVLALVAKGQVKLTRLLMNVDPNLGHVVSHDGILTATFVTDAEPERKTRSLDPDEFPVEVNRLVHSDAQPVWVGLIALHIVDDVLRDTGVSLLPHLNLVKWCVEQVEEIELCPECDRTIEACDADPNIGFEDHFSHGRNGGHYTVEVSCKGFGERHGDDFDEPDFDEPDDDDGYYADQAADAYERSLGGGW